MRESKGSDNVLKVDALGFFDPSSSKNAVGSAGDNLVDITNAIEMGRIACRDIGGSDPERMNPQNLNAYVNDILKSSDIKVAFFI